jgi:hypothetical protein
MRLRQLFLSQILLSILACNGEEVQGENDGAYYQKYFEACADSSIDVEDVSLLCDSPGAYYYGNGKYRNSKDCMHGDKGHVKIYFYISDELQGQEPYVSLKVRDDSNQEVQDSVLYDNELLCSISGLSAQDGQSCPEEGYYYISSTTYLGEKDGSGQYFDSVTEIGFRTNPEIAYFDLGGANSDYCEGGTFGKYSYGKMRKQVASAVGSFLVTWGTLLFVVIAVAGIAYFLIQRMRRRNDVPFEDADEDLLDGHYNQVIVMSSSRSLVDF